MKNEIPIGGVRAPGRHRSVRPDPQFRARHQLQGARTRQPLRRRHELLPEHRGGEPRTDCDGQRAPSRRPSARANGRERVSSPSGEQIEIAFGNQRAVIVEVGGGLRSFSVGSHAVLDGYEANELCTSGRGQVLIPWPNRLADGEIRVRWSQPPTSARASQSSGNAIHGLVRWSAWGVRDRVRERVVVEHVLRPPAGISVHSCAQHRIRAV